MVNIVPCVRIKRFVCSDVNRLCLLKISAGAMP